MERDAQPDLVEDAVRSYLDTEASHIDGHLVLERARATVRRRHTLRRAAAWAAMAAAIVIATVAVFVIPSPPADRSKGSSDFFARFTDEGKRSARNLAGVCSTVNRSVEQTFRDVTKTLPRDVTPKIADAPSDFVRSFSEDASHVRQKVASGFRHLLDKAGFTL